MFLRRLYLFAIVLTFAWPLSAQNTGTISGSLQDSVTRQKLPFATITVFTAKDTSIITYRLSNLEGEFKVPGLPLGIPYRVLISYSGYQVLRIETELSDQKSQLELGKLSLIPNSQSLDEVLVVAERPPVVVRNDTIEFNASSFKTLPNALVEDLLKKLPGVAVDKGGNITVNGKIVNRILVDGKDFFGSDPKIATRNLPANVIEKVQVVDDQEELDENIFMNRANVGKVINLKLKKGIKKGLFGKAYAGGGTDEKYEAGGILNLFRDTLQVSLLGFSNNINKPAFSRDEVGSIGGFNRSGYSSSMMAKDGSFALDGISFGGAADGIQTSTAAGINANTELSKNAGLNIRYFYGDIKNRLEESRNTRQFLGDSILETRSLSSLFSANSSHRIGTTLRWKLDSFSSLTIRTSINLTHTNSDRQLNTISVHNFKGTLNESDNKQRITEQYNNLLANLNYRKNFRKRGRSLSIGSNMSFLRRDNDQLNFVENIFYSPPASSLLDQLRQRENPYALINVFASYSEPLSRSARLQLTHTVSYTGYKDNLETFLKYSGGYKHDSLAGNLTNKLDRKSWMNTSTVGLEWRSGQLFVTPAFNIYYLSAQNSLADIQSPKQHYFYALPGLNLSWQGLFFMYRQSIIEPPATTLQPVADNTNPLFIYKGNPGLKPALSHSIYLTFDKYNTARSLTYRFLFNSFFEENGIISSRTVGENGVQVSQPVNVSGLWNFRTNTSVTKQFKAINSWSLSLTGAVFVDFRKTKLIVNNNETSLGTWNINPSISYSFNWKDQVEINQEYSPGLRRGRYDKPFFQDLNVTTHFLTTECIVRFRNGMVLESSLDYYSNPGIAAGISGNILRWNGAINFQFLKERRANLKISAFDILNQNREVTRTIAENYISDVRRTALQRFFMLTLTYNIRDFRAKVGGRNRLLFL